MTAIVKRQAVISELKRLAVKDGGVLHCEKVVEAARKVSNPLHNEFTWDDTEAAHKCRLQEARQLINVCVEYLSTGEETYETRVFVSLHTDRRVGGYRTMVTVMSDRSMREELLNDAMQEMVSFKNKYRTLTELAKVFEAMDSVLK